jgi:hypothetical protein
MSKPVLCRSCWSWDFGHASKVVRTEDIKFQGLGRVCYGLT